MRQAFSACTRRSLSALVLLSAFAYVAASTVVEFDSPNATYAHGQYVNVRWSGVGSADRSSCWLGLFFYGANMSYIGFDPAFPSTPPYLATAPIKFVSCSSPGFEASGIGQRSMRLLAYRSPLQVALFTGGFDKTAVPRLLARSASPLIASDGDKPRHPRLSLTSSRDQMRLTWSTHDPLPQIVYLSGLAPQRATSTVKTYTAADLCGAPANASGYADPGYHHSVLFKNLMPGIYSYHVGKNLTGEFTISHSRSVRIGIIADVGATEPDGMHYHWEEPNASTTYRLTSARNPDLVLHLGDIAYSTGYAAKWDLFLEEMTSISGRVPYMTAFGNHEQDFHRGAGTRPHALRGTDSGGECGVPTYTRFPMPVPENGDESQASGWYQFTQGPAAFVIFNSEWNVSHGSDQYNFLRAALASVDRSATPWVVVGCHRPIYTSNHTDGEDSMLGYNDVEDLMKEFEVDFMFYGHIHNAQRTCPIYRSQCTTSKTPGGFAGTVHAVVGNGGQGLVPFAATRAPWSLFQTETFGFNELELNETTAVLRFFSDANRILDETVYSVVSRLPQPEVVV